MPKTFVIIALSILLSFVTFIVQAAEDTPAKSTATPQALLQLSIAVVKESWLDNKQVISISFSHSLMENEDYSRFVTVTENGVSLKGQWSQSEDKKSLYLKNIKPENNYKIFIRPGIKSANGLKLLSPEHFSITTTHALPSIEFEGAGNIFSTHEPVTLQINSTNIEQQKISVYRLKGDEQDIFIQKLQKEPNVSNWGDESLSQFSELVSEQDLELKPAADPRITSQIELKNNAKSPSAGLFFIVIKGKTKIGEEISEISYFMISDFTLHIDNLSSHIEVLAVSQNTAKLLPKVKTKLITKDKVVQAETDKIGFTKLALESSAPTSLTWVLAKYDKQFVLKKVPLGQQTDDTLGVDSAKVFLNKSHYKLGDKVEFSVLLRDKNNRAMSATTLRVILRNPSGMIESEKIITTAELGYISSFFLLPKSIDVIESKNNAWNLEVSFSEEEGAEIISSTRFSVFERDYKNARLDFSNASSIFDYNEKNKFALRGMIDEKKPADSAFVVMKQNIKWLRHPVEKYKDFSFGIPSDETLQGESVIQTVELNSNGESKFVLPKIKNKINSILSLSLQADLQQNNYSIASKTKELIYWPADNMVGVRTLNWGSEDVAFGVSIEIVNVNPQSDLQAVKNLDVSIYQLSDQADWVYVEEFAWTKEGNNRIELIEERTVSLDESKIEAIDLALDAGDYRIEVKNPNTNLLTSYDFAVGKKMGDDLPPDQLKLSINKELYQKSETALLSIESAFSADAIVRLASGDTIYKMEKITLSQGQTQLKIPFDKLALWGEKQNTVTDLQLSVRGFHLEKGHFFTSYGKTTFGIEKSKLKLTAILEDGNRIIHLHSDDYKDVSAVVILKKVLETVNADNKAVLPLLQTIFFNKQGEATVNNQEMKILPNQEYIADLYFADNTVTDVDVKFKK